mmetsp:Transcript_43470/g.63805  ORF Transcript_43470/g.63805 Transcript_43470/m.63805 type:complete len:191 (-) Transcript_43470:730-1302(-)
MGSDDNNPNEKLIPDEENQGAENGRRNRRRHLHGVRKSTQHPILYSPLHYWIKVLFGGLFTVMNVVTSATYVKDCKDLPNYSPGDVWWILLTLFWGLQAIIHLFFIINRFINKAEVTEKLYDGPIETRMKYVTLFFYVCIVGIAIWGLFLMKDNPCNGKFNDEIQIKSWIYGVLALLFVIHQLHLKDPKD